MGKFEFQEQLEQRWGKGGAPQVALGPGRVNLIGEHTDYNNGYVFPVAIDRTVKVAFRPSRDDLCRFWSCRYGEEDTFSLDGIEQPEDGGWKKYVRGVPWALSDCSLKPIEAVIEGDVPLGAGLSSSAAIEVAVALAFCEVAGERPDSKQLALLCQRAENGFVGVNCGIMDQFVSIHGAENHAVFIDCLTLDYQLVPLDASRAQIVVCNTMVHHELGASAYNERRASCEAAAEKIATRRPKVESLRDVGSGDLEACKDLLDPVAYRRARHVVTEDERVLESIDALNAGDLERFGVLMNESHESLRDDYEVSCEELDLMVSLARGVGGCLGSRLTGAGFGGCTVNLVQAAAVDAFTDRVGSAYEEQTGLKPEIYVCTPSSGARVVP